MQRSLGDLAQYVPRITRLMVREPEQLACVKYWTELRSLHLVFCRPVPSFAELQNILAGTPGLTSLDITNQISESGLLQMIGQSLTNLESFSLICDEPCSS